MRPIHPGEILRDELAELGMSARAFATALHIPVNRVTQILREQRGVSADTALRLGRYFGTSPEFWMDLQSDYELRRARRDVGPAIEPAVCPRAA
jgi:antitoxin HigA-1